MNHNARQLAYHVLIDIEQNGAYANIALDKALLHSGLNPSDRRLATELVYGCTKMKLHLDQVINAYCDLKKVDKYTLMILRMAVYQICFLEKIPMHAIVNETVELSKKEGHHSDKFINGVLRSMERREKNVVWPDKRKQRNQFFAKWYSFPQWMIDIWVKMYGFSAAEQLCMYFNAPAATWLRVNTLKVKPEEVIISLEKNNVKYEQHPMMPEAIRVDSLQVLKDTNALKSGQLIVQDFSAMLPSVILAPAENQCVLDMCAAPGGKTTHLSAIMNGNGRIVACDLHPHRVKLIEENVKKLGIKNVECFATDARALPACFNYTFDAILLDAPCSGLGVLNRRADLRWRVRRGGLGEIECLQRELLDAAVRYLKPNGTIVYSTCTLNKGENESQIQAFLERHPDFELESFDVLDKHIESGMYTIVPYEAHSDGFFIAKLHRKE